MFFRILLRLARLLPFLPRPYPKYFHFWLKNLKFGIFVTNNVSQNPGSFL